MNASPKRILGRAKLSLPPLKSAMVAVAKRTNGTKLVGLLSLVAVLVLVFAFLFIRHVLNRPEAPSGSGEVIAPLENPEDALRHPLTGEKLESELATDPQVFAVMVENSYEAWPLSGLNGAFLVIEAPVEGNIPRFITFFYEGQDEVKKIGPVRSARPYYLDWANELHAIYAHVGGSPEALGLLSSKDITDLDQFYQSEYFWRDETTRFAPHNVYTSTDLLMSTLEEFTGSDIHTPIASWLFKDDEKTADAAVSPHIDWTSGEAYDVTWKYSADKNAYERYQAGEAFQMTSGDLIWANNVIIMETDITVVDDVGRRHAVTVGEGNAVVYQDGKKIAATWKKADDAARLRFFNESGEEIRMNAGKTWIEVIESLDKVTDLAN